MGISGQISADDYRKIVYISNRTVSTSKDFNKIGTNASAKSAASTGSDAVTFSGSLKAKMESAKAAMEKETSDLMANASGNQGNYMDVAQSRVRDVDMAKEMLEFTKTNILNQAATSMLAQAPKQTEGVLQLLR